MLEPRSLNTQRKAVVSIIVILNYLEIGVKVSDNSVKTTEFGKYREMLNIDKVANSVELYFLKNMNGNLLTHLSS